MVVRGPSLKDHISQRLVDRISAARHIRVLANSEVTALDRDHLVEAIIVANNVSNEQQRFAGGDLRHGSVERCVSALGEGAMAISFVHRYLAQAWRVNQ